MRGVYIHTLILFSHGVDSLLNNLNDTLNIVCCVGLCIHTAIAIELFNNQPANELFIIKRETPFQAQTVHKKKRRTNYIFLLYIVNR